MTYGFLSYIFCKSQVFVFNCIFILLSRKRPKRYNELAKELPAIYLPHQEWEIPLSAFPNGKTSKLVGLFSTLSL